MSPSRKVAKKRVVKVATKKPKRDGRTKRSSVKKVRVKTISRKTAKERWPNISPEQKVRATVLQQLPQSKKHPLVLSGSFHPTDYVSGDTISVSQRAVMDIQKVFNSQLAVQLDVLRYKYKQFCRRKRRKIRLDSDDSTGRIYSYRSPKSHRRVRVEVPSEESSWNREEMALDLAEACHRYPTLQGRAVYSMAMKIARERQRKSVQI